MAFAQRATGPEYAPPSERLDYLRGASPKWRERHDEFVARLRALEVGAHAPRVGDRFPEIVVTDHRGRCRTLDGLLAGGPLALDFNSGGWCPYWVGELESWHVTLPGSRTPAEARPRDGGTGWPKPSPRRYRRAGGCRAHRRLTNALTAPYPRREHVMRVRMRRPQQRDHLITIIVTAPRTNAMPTSKAKAVNVPRIGRIAWKRSATRVRELFIEASL